MKPIFLYLFNYLFVELAIILNVAKWFYFFFIMKTHRSIREYEINEAIIHEEEDSESLASNILVNTETTTDDENLLTDSKDKSNSIKLQQLSKLKTRTYIIYIVVAILATALSSTYSYYTIRFVIDGFNEIFGEFYNDYSETLMLRWINSAAFTFGQIFMSLVMMCLLRVRFV